MDNSDNKKKTTKIISPEKIEEKLQPSTKYHMKQENLSREKKTTHFVKLIY